MNLRVYVLVALAVLALILIHLPTHQLPSDFQDREEQIAKCTETKLEQGQRMTLSDAEAIMGRKPEHDQEPLGLMVGQWSWLDKKTGERIDVEGFGPDDVYSKRSSMSPSPQPYLVDYLRTWLGW